MKPTPPLRDERAGEHEHAGEPYILRHGDTLYRVTAASARDATVEVLAFLDDPNVWRGEIETFTEALYRELYGEPDVVVDVEPGPGAFPSGYSAETACPVCRPGAVADGARPVRCILHGGDDADVQPTNASASGFRLAGEAGETAGWIVRTGDRDVAAGAAPMEAAERARRIGHDDGHLRPATAAELDSLDLPPSALGIEAGAVPWWRPVPAPEVPEGDPDRAVYLPAGADALGPLMHAWGAVYDHDPATGEPAREYLGVGRLVGHVQRERFYDRDTDTAYFEVAGEGREAVQSDDVVLPIVESLAGPVYLPDYPRCPDCGGRIEWAEAGGVPGSRRCAGMTLPDLPAAGMAADPPGVTSDREAGCGSRFVDTRFGLASPVPGDDAHGQPDDVDGEAAPDTPETRCVAFTAAMAGGDTASAYAIARVPFPADWPEDERRRWGGRRKLAQAALDAGEDAADADSDRRDFEAGDDLTWRDAGSGS